MVSILIFKEPISDVSFAREKYSKCVLPSFSY